MRKMVFCVCSIVFLLSLSIEVHATGHRGKNRGDEKGTVEEARKIIRQHGGKGFYFYVDAARVTDASAPQLVRELGGA